MMPTCGAAARVQLFTIGLWELNIDGTYRLDASGEPIGTYTNEDIVDFSRVWTGHDRQQPRGGVENYEILFRAGLPTGPPNKIDPMRIRGIWRDPYPKACTHRLNRGLSHLLAAR